MVKKDKNEALHSAHISSSINMYKYKSQAIIVALALNIFKFRYTLITNFSPFCSGQYTESAWLNLFSKCTNITVYTARNLVIL